MGEPDLLPPGVVCLGEIARAVVTRDGRFLAKRPDGLWVEIDPPDDGLGLWPRDEVGP